MDNWLKKHFFKFRRIVLGCIVSFTQGLGYRPTLSTHTKYIDPSFIFYKCWSNVLRRRWWNGVKPALDLYLDRPNYALCPSVLTNYALNR